MKNKKIEIRLSDGELDLLKERSGVENVSLSSYVLTRALGVLTEKEVDRPEVRLEFHEYDPRRSVEHSRKTISNYERMLELAVGNDIYKEIEGWKELEEELLWSLENGPKDMPGDVLTQMKRGSDI